MRIKILASKYRLNTLKKCTNRLIFHIYILACHLQIDTDPDPDFYVMRARILFFADAEITNADLFCQALFQSTQDIYEEKEGSGSGRPTTDPNTVLNIIMKFL
jgi:hypothetical protein